MAHDFPERQAASPGTSHDPLTPRVGSLEHLDLLGEETPDARALAVALAPAAGGRQRDDRSRTAALGQLECDATAHGVADEVRRADTQLVQQSFDRVGGMLEGDRLIGG